MTPPRLSDPLPPLREVIQAHGLRADKKFGQNFILDLNLTRRIAREAGDLTQCDVIEVGPGPGGLTRGLLMEGAAHVHVIETDERFLPALEEIQAAYPNRLSIHLGDALKISPESLTQAPYRIVSNLPYNVATPLLTGWLDAGWQDGVWAPQFLSMTLMFQKEVAQRICEKEGSKVYGILSVLVQAFYEAEYLFTVPPSVFVPPPKVESGVLRLTRKADYSLPCDEKLFFRVVKSAFQQRRKTLRNSLKTYNLSDNLKANTIFDKRPEQLSVQAFIELTLAIETDQQPI